MYSFNPFKLPSVKVLQNTIIEKKEIIDDGVPVVVTTKKRKVKPGERLVKQYKKSQRGDHHIPKECNDDIDFDEIIEKISKIMPIVPQHNR